MSNYSIFSTGELIGVMEKKLIFKNSKLFRFPIKLTHLLMKSGGLMANSEQFSNNTHSRFIKICLLMKKARTK